ncbi:hypothetical protein ACFFKU_18260 [Kineococcus gynurae]|uniref:Uncharacterized protein n=1 Tax=Kineococcus gynurae TaxID=452979 RepID=A0ABV5LNI3_9ACTN
MATPVLPEPLRRALRQGRRDDVVAALLALTPADRRSLRRPLAHQHEVTGAAPIGALAPAGEWSGRLRVAHQSAAVAGWLACCGLPTALRLWPLDPADARDLPPLLHPDDLPAFVTAWSQRFERRPKGYERNRGIEAMFDWAHAGLVPPPTERGAVLLLATAVPGVMGGVPLLRYLEARPVLIATTMAAIFDVDGVPGASPAQADQTVARPSRRLDDFVVPELVRRGYWTRRFVLDGVDRALERGQTPYHRRWFEGLAAHVRAA